jgi:hypothetical protein
MKFGATIWMVVREAPCEDGIRAIGRLGFRAVELIAWRREVPDGYYTPARSRELRTVAEGEGVEISNLTATIPGIGSADPGGARPPSTTCCAWARWRGSSARAS